MAPAATFAASKRERSFLLLGLSFYPLASRFGQRLANTMIYASEQKWGQQRAV